MCIAKKLGALIFNIICLLIIVSPSEAKIKLGTYGYPNIDRYKAVAPLGELISAVTGQETEVLVVSSPTQLSEDFQSGDLQIIVPNLVGFLNTTLGHDEVFLVAVPDNTSSTYTSSIITSNLSLDRNHFPLSSKAKIGMVWPDSASGSMIAGTYISNLDWSPEVSMEDFVDYLGSHQAVFKAVLTKDVEIGVLATQVFLEREKEGDGQVKELWRSAPIPYGPIVCAKNIMQLCQAIQKALLKDSKLSLLALDGLKSGWPEFQNSTVFTAPDETTYSDLKNYFVQSKVKKLE